MKIPTFISILNYSNSFQLAFSTTPLLFNSFLEVWTLWTYISAIPFSSNLVFSCFSTQVSPCQSNESFSYSMKTHAHSSRLPLLIRWVDRSRPSRKGTGAYLLRWRVEPSPSCKILPYRGFTGYYNICNDGLMGCYSGTKLNQISI